MSIMTGCLILLGIFGSISCGLLVLLFNVVGQVTLTNKQLLISLAGKEAKPETLRALVASNKPPQKPLPGIAGKKGKDDKKPKNTNYTMKLGVDNGL